MDSAGCTVSDVPEEQIGEGGGLRYLFPVRALAAFARILIQTATAKRIRPPCIVRAPTNATLLPGSECRRQHAYLLGRHTTLDGRAALSGSEVGAISS